MPEKRNVLYIVIDQLRADVLSGALSGHVPTPNIDALAAAGAVFENHFAVTLPCGPSRASLHTGQYAMNHRSIRNGTPLASWHTNIALEVRRLGYEPLLFGYTDTSVDPRGRDPNDPDLATCESVLPGFREIVEMRWETAEQWTAHLRSLGYSVPDSAPGMNLTALYRPVDGTLGGPALYRADHSDTAFLTDQTIKALSIRRGRPWFAHVTYIRPHPPLVAPDPWHRLVDPANIPLAVQNTLEHPFFEAWFSQPLKGLYWGFDGNYTTMATRTAQTLRAIYLGLVAEVDHHIGRLLNFLKDSGQAGETLVVLTADHGVMLGDKGLWGKESVFDPAFHVPLIVFDPAAPRPSRISAITESIDITPTLLDWLVGSIPASMDGKSLLPWITGEWIASDTPTDWRSAAFMEIEFGEQGHDTRFQQTFGLDAERCRAAILRDTRWKYIHFAGGVPPMLFDMQNDPLETRDLAASARYAGTLSEMARRMLDHRMTFAARPVHFRPPAAG